MTVFGPPLTLVAVEKFMLYRTTAEDKQGSDRASVKKLEGGQRYPVDSASSDEWPGFPWAAQIIGRGECVPARPLTLFDTVLTTIRLR